jgi:hypothetical protein
MSEIFGQLKAELPVETVIRLIAVNYQHIISVCRIRPGKQGRKGALAAAALPAQ